MRASIVSSLVVLARFAAISLAIPMTTGITAALAPRSQFCDNAPTVVAGNSFDRRSLAPRDLVHRTDPVRVWCAPGSRTYITVALVKGTVPAKAFTYMLAAALSGIANQLAHHGDGLIPLGVFIQGDRSGYHELYVANSNNHQQTWAVTNAALLALQSFLTHLNTIAGDFAGGVTFTVFDGTNGVSQGSIE